MLLDEYLQELADPTDRLTLQREINIDDCFNDDITFSTALACRPEKEDQLNTEEFEHCCAVLIKHGEPVRIKQEIEFKKRKIVENIRAI